MKIVGLRWCLACCLIGSWFPRTLCNNYDFMGRDFRNTQTEMLCLLARLNASIEIRHRPSGFNKEISIPFNAINNQSQCDYNFLSILRLEFKGVKFQLNFQRDVVEALSTQRGYCDNCDNGDWKLEEIKVAIKNTTALSNQFPSARLKGNVGGSQLSDVSGGLTTGISVIRGYRCVDQTLSAVLVVQKAVDLSTLKRSTEEWDLQVTFYAIEVQPFLVTNNMIKEPVLCKDVSVFIALIISVPIIYFFFFIMIYRMKERYGCPPNWNRKILLNESNDKALSKSEVCETKPDHSLVQTSVKSDHIRVTCTGPDEMQKPIL